MNEINFTISGIPIPQKRARYCSQGSFVRVYDPQAKEKKDVSQRIVQAVLEESQGKNCDIEMEASNSQFYKFFSLEVWFYMPIPDGLKNMANNENLGHIQHAIKPDVDNLLKFFMDCANGILWHDDSMVCSVKAKKIYSKNPRTKVRLMTCQFPSHNSLFVKVFSTLSKEEIEDISKFFNNWEYLSNCLKPENEILPVWYKLENAEKEFIDFFQKYGDKIQKMNSLVKKESKKHV